jgi:hypothetical protein
MDRSAAASNSQLIADQTPERVKSSGEGNGRSFLGFLKSITRRAESPGSRARPRLLVEVAHKGLHKHGEELCGDWVKISTTDSSFIAVLSDGLGSGVKANIMATLTAEIAATMLEQGAPIDDAIETLVATLPECKIRHLAYATFCILHVHKGRQAYLVEYDAPPLFLVRRGQVVALPRQERAVWGRTIHECQFDLQEGDYMVMVSDGYIHAGVGRSLKLGWGWENIAQTIEKRAETHPDAYQLLNSLTRICSSLYEGKPGDDATAVAMRARRVISATVWSGPPADKGLDKPALDRLMAEHGTRVICGGTTAQVAARLLGAPLKVRWNLTDANQTADDEKIPPIAYLRGMDLVTEGIITISKTIERVKEASTIYDLPVKEDGATQLARILLNADKIHFIIGDAINPQQVGDLVRGKPMRQLLLDDLINDLRGRGKVISTEHL